MKFKSLLIAISLLAIMCACKKKTNEPTLTSGIHKEYLDTTANPKEDFYQFACGGWMKLFPLPKEYARFGSFEKLEEDNMEQLKSLITGLAAEKHEAGSIAQKIGDLYNIGMDSATLEAQGAEPIQAQLKEIATIRQLKEVGAACAKISLNAANPFMGIFGEADPKNSNMKIAWAWQSGLSIGDRDYYLLDDFKEIRSKFSIMVSQMLKISNYSKIAGFEGKETQMAENILKLETQMAQVYMRKEDAREPELTYHFVTLQEFEKMVPNMHIADYLNVLGLKIDSINVGMPDYFKGLDKILANTPIETIKAYMAWKVINSAASYLSDEFVNIRFDFYGKTLSGREQQQARWKRVINTVNGCLGEAVGQMYVEKYFPETAKQRMDNLVSNLQIALKERIEGSSWMSEETKNQAKEKLAAFHVKIGYPDKWRSYDNLNIEKDSYWANVSRANEFETLYELSKIGKEIDKDEWLMTPQTINAYYNPSTNEICFPAAILQPPFFDMNADDAANYGAIGVVIGHEMTHGFDDQGCKYDKNGNLSNWWTEEDAANFKSRTKILEEWFNQIEVLPGLYANGAFTLGENIADNGGLNISYVAMQKAKTAGEITENMDGFTAEQRFFIAYATVWAANIRDKEISRRTKEDPHSLGKWRVNGTLPHVTPFIEAFDIKEGDAMYLAPEKRALIW